MVSFMTGRRFFHANFKVFPKIFPNKKILHVNARVLWTIEPEG